VPKSYTNERRRRSRRNSQFSPAEWALVESVLRQDYSPAQVVGWFARFTLLTISHETIYRNIRHDKQRGGTLHVHLRRENMRFRKRYGPATAAGVSPASGTSPRDRLAPRIAPASDIGKSTRCLAPVEAVRAS